MENRSEAVDVAIVGGGLAGLTAAALLARSGQTVTVLEKATHLGGRAMTTIVGDFHLNLGPHAWFVAGRATDILRSLGVELQGKVPAPTGAYALHGGRLHPLPIGLISMLTTDLLSLSGKFEVARTLASVSRANTSALDGMSTDEWLDRVASDPVARMFLAAVIRTATYVHSPSLLSAGAAITQLALAQKGNVWYLDRGWQHMIDAIAERARSFGARLRTGVHVRELVVESRRVRGVRLDDGRIIEAENVIVATPPEAVRQLLTRGGVPRFQTIEARAACLDLGLARLPRPNMKFAIGVDVPLYYSVHSATALLAPAGRAVIHLAKYLDPLRKTNSKDDEADLENMMDLLQPGWRSEVIVRRFLPAMTVTHGIPTASGGGLTGRPGVAVDGITGLYLSGDWVGDEGQLGNAAVVSAARAAERIVRGEGRQAA